MFWFWLKHIFVTFGNMVKAKLIVPECHKSIHCEMLAQIPDHTIVSTVGQALTEHRSFVNTVNISHLQWCANKGDLKKITNDKYLTTSAHFLRDQLPVKWHWIPLYLQLNIVIWVRILQWLYVTYLCNIKWIYIWCISTLPLMLFTVFATSLAGCLWTSHSGELLIKWLELTLVV
jgi:hypothetical protein